MQMIVISRTYCNPSAVNNLFIVAIHLTFISLPFRCIVCTQIAQDILWFLLFIVVVVIAAGQIFFTMLYNPENCTVGDEDYDEYKSMFTY